MIHYHGTPLGGRNAAAVAILRRRHAMASFADGRLLPLIGEVCQSFALDNGAFTIWKSTGGEIDAGAYLAWVQEWSRHPGFDWCIIPDSIDGGVRRNDRLLERWRGPAAWSVPVFHIAEPLDRLKFLVAGPWPRVALGSSGEFPTPGTRAWWGRMAEVMAVACDELGRPLVKLHGLRMMDPRIFSRVPLASADSTNVARNSREKDPRWERSAYKPVSQETRATILMERIEWQEAAARWRPPEPPKRRNK